MWTLPLNIGYMEISIVNDSDEFIERSGSCSSGSGSSCSSGGSCGGGCGGGD